MEDKSAVFHNPDVYRPPPGDLTTPTFEDTRGSIRRIVIGDRSYNLLYTRRGVFRSGDLHRTQQFDHILSGKVEVWMREGGTDRKTIYGPGDSVTIPPGVPHLFRFLEDTVMAEWWDGPFETWYYRPYRDIVEGRAQLP